MRLTHLLAAAAALSMAALPALAASPKPVNPAAGLSLTDDGAGGGAPVKRAGKGATVSTPVVAGVAVAAVVAGALALSHRDSKAASS